MSITSLQFIAFFAISLLFYYVLPNNARWFGLLVASAIFFILSCEPKTGFYLLGCILETHASCVIISKSKNKKPRISKFALILGIISNISILAALKYSNFFVRNWNIVSSILHFPRIDYVFNWAAPIGISFYTLQAIGMIVDTYWGVVEPNNNIFKTALFIAYYPQLTSGPISRYQNMEKTFFENNTFSYKNLTHGVQRMLWGFFKKLVLSSRISVLVNTIYNNFESYPSLYIFFAACLFMLQLYTDFSGCMDIIIGASETYGINLPENFRTPFFSQSVQEFWQRWHITLGGFMRDYVMYPILRTGLWKKLEKSIKKKFGKKAAKQIPSYLAMLFVWLLIGLWHGGLYKYIIGQGLWFWVCIILEQVGAPLWKKIITVLHIKHQSFSFHLFRSIKTYLLVSFGNIFFRADDFNSAINIIKFTFSGKSNPWIFFDGSLYSLGLDGKDMAVVFLGLFVLLVVSVLQEKGSVRDMIDQQNIWFRWFVYYLLFFIIVIFGKYGPGYNASDFIYKGF